LNFGAYTFTRIPFELAEANRRAVYEIIIENKGSSTVKFTLADIFRTTSLTSLFDAAGRTINIIENGIPVEFTIKADDPPLVFYYYTGSVQLPYSSTVVNTVTVSYAGKTSQSSVTVTTPDEPYIPEEETTTIPPPLFTTTAPPTTTETPPTTTTAEQITTTTAEPVTTTTEEPTTPAPTTTEPIPTTTPEPITEPEPTTSEEEITDVTVPLTNWTEPTPPPKEPEEEITEPTIPLTNWTEPTEPEPNKPNPITGANILAGVLIIAIMIVSAGAIWYSKKGIKNINIK
jgi:hypothetical protein